MSWIEELQIWLAGAGTEPTKEIHGNPTAIETGRIVNFLPFPLLLCDDHFTILWANHVFKRLFHLHDKALLEKKPLPMVLGIAAEDFTRQIGEKGERKLLEGNFPKIGKRAFHVFMHTFSLKGQANRILIFQDVTAGKELEEKIMGSRQELLSIFDGFDDPIVIVDSNFKIRRINDTMLKICAATSYQEVIGKTCYERLHNLQHICPECTVNDTFATGLKTTRIGLLETRPDAENYGYRINCYPLRDQSGNVTGVAEFYRDLSESIQTKEELIESERGRITELLAAGIAHEVRNPLAIIQANAQFCLDTPDKNEAFQESIESILSSAKEANRVIQGLLDFAKPQEIHFERQSLQPILEEGLSLVRARVQQQHVKLKVSVPRRLKLLLLDRKRLIQAILNYLFNALDAMPEGGVLRVSARCCHQEQMVEIMIQDTGKGVPEELIPKLFQPFYTTKKGGVGLGFSVAEGIIRSHGGKVLFKSLEGKGSCVQLQLPYYREL